MRPVAIVGFGQTGFRSHVDEPYPELVFKAARLTLDDAGLSIRDVDAVVLPMAPEALGGVGHGERWVVDAAGAIGKPFMRVNTGGVTGLSAVEVAYWQIASGLADRVLVLAAGRLAMDLPRGEALCAADELQALGVGVPDIVGLAKRLRRLLPTLPATLTTADELADAVLTALRQAR